VETTEVNDTLSEEEEPTTSKSPLQAQLSSDVQAFVSIYGFSSADFSALYEPLESILSATHRGRYPAIDLLDSFLLFLHWLRTGSSFETIGAGFHISPETVRKHVLEVTTVIQKPLIERFVTSVAHTPFAVREDFPECGLIVGATVQNRGHPVGTAEEARKYDSGKHHFYCLKSHNDGSSGDGRVDYR
jgi:hypothetical protein